MGGYFYSFCKIFKIYLFILFLVVLSFQSLVVESRSCSLVVVHRFLIAVASLVVERGL